MNKLILLGAKTKELIAKNQFILYLVVFFLGFFTYLWLQATLTFLDPDSFYHLKMVKLIAAKGPILNFPWLQFTILKNIYIDHHFLYHVLAIPFVKFLGDFVGFKLYTVILATLFLLLSYAFLKKEKIKAAEIFVLFLLFAPDFMFRISLAKASAFSLIILFGGIYFILKEKYWPLILISFLYVWSYGGFSLILVMAIIFGMANSLEKTIISAGLNFRIKRHWLKKIVDYVLLLFKNFFTIRNLKPFLAVLTGIILGVVINPYFPKNLSFYWQQLVQIGIINYRGKVNVGGEWYPYDIFNLISDSGAAMILGAISLILFFIFIKKQKNKSIFFGLAAFLFFIMTLKSKRYVEYFIPFLVYFSAFTINYIWQNVELKKFIAKVKQENYVLGVLSKFVLIYVIIIFPLLMAKDAYITKKSYIGGISFQRFEGIANYLEKNSKPGEIVMQTDWSDFPMLFYHNDQNYYIVGLDPTFMYNYDAKLYNLFADITMAKKSNDLYHDIKDVFRASYFIVNKDRLQLAINLQNDGNFAKVYEDSDGSLYKLK